MITKTQAIDSIQAINPTAPKNWLRSFDLASLRDYLSHLEHATHPKQPSMPGWQRLHNFSATTTRRACH
ncbi:MAG: hypothetical protein P8J86_09635 [Phycisphaerales bacterium]|nr:hypothetical protein [Phycisphaerales bacterium]